MAFKISKWMQDQIDQYFLTHAESIDTEPEVLEPSSFNYTFPSSDSYLTFSGVMPPFDETITYKFSGPLMVGSGPNKNGNFDIEYTAKAPPKVEDDGVRRRIKRGGYPSQE